MSADKTRVIPRNQADSTAVPPPRLVGGQIVFLCPAGHRIVVPVSLAGKHGTCSKCSVPLRIPETSELASVESAAQPAVTPAASPATAALETAPPAAPAGPPPPAVSESDWNFIAAEQQHQTGDRADEGDWSPGGDLGSIPFAGEVNPMARMLARLWAERDHGGVIELHLAGGAVILPEEFSVRWSGASHGLFASQAADGSVTLTAVAWDTVQRIVVRHLAAVPGDMFE